MAKLAPIAILVMLVAKVSRMAWSDQKLATGSNSLSTDACLANDPSELAIILTQCHEFYNYYMCTVDKAIQINRSSEWREIIEIMLEKCKGYISDVKSAPELEIDLEKMTNVLKSFIKPSDWNACNNFHAYTCEYSLRRLYSSPSPEVMRPVMHDVGDTYLWSEKNEGAVTEILERTIWKLVRFVRRSDSEWTGPVWVKKFLLVFGICQDDKTYCDKMNSVINRWVGPANIVEYIKIRLYAYITPTLPGYNEAKSFIDSLVPLIRKEAIYMIKEWAGAGDTSSLVDFIEHKLGFQTDIWSDPEGHNKMMNKFTESLIVTPESSEEIFEKFSKWWSKVPGDVTRELNIKDWQSLYIARYGSFFNGIGGFVHYGGLTLVPPAFSLNLSYAFVFGDSVFALSHEIAHMMQQIMDKNAPHVEGFYSYFRDCLIDEYGKAPIYFKGKKLLNGGQTYGENFADVIGVQLAWRMYQKYYRRRDNVPKASGFTKEQLFFAAVSSSVPMCSSRYPNQTSLERWQAVDVHTIGENRINLLMMHTPEFAKAFKCPIGSKMNPYKNCVKLLDLKTY